LGLKQDQVFPVSAQKGLLAKVQNDAALLAKSRLLDLERALSMELIPQKQLIVRDIVEQEIGDLICEAQATFASRSVSLDKQSGELSGLRGQNTKVVAHMMGRVRAEKDEFDKNMVQFMAMRSVFSKLSNEVFQELGLSRLRQEVHETRAKMESAAFSKGLRDAMRQFFIDVRNTLDRSQQKSADIYRMADGMIEKMSAQNGWQLPKPMNFSLARYQNEIQRIETIYQQRFGLLTILSNDQVILTRKFFESIASRVKETFEMANRDAEAWFKTLFAPLEGQLREHQSQLKRRLESIKQIQGSTESLDERINEVGGQQIELDRMSAQLREFERHIDLILHAPIDAEQGALIL
jgi:hypothetical protein